MRLRLRTGLLTFIGLALASVGCDGVRAGLASQALPEGSESEARLADGPWTVAELDLDLADESRPTMENGEFPGTSYRALGVTVWSPTGAEGRLPFVVYAHGFTGHRREMVYLPEHLASHGYLVAALDFPLTTGEAPGGPNFMDLASQPGDVRFVIDQLLAGDAEGRIDTGRIAVAGLSYGGLTSTLLAFHPTEADPRIRAAISIAGPTEMFGEGFFAREEAPPFLMIAGTEDGIVPFAGHAAPIPRLRPQAGLLAIEGGTHLGFVDFARGAFRFARNSDETACDGIRALGEDPQADAAQDPFIALGGAANGIDGAAWQRPCVPDHTFGLAMRPERQQAITSLAVRAFLDAELAAERAQREEAARFLWETLAPELGSLRATPPAR